MRPASSVASLLVLLLTGCATSGPKTTGDVATAGARSRAALERARAAQEAGDAAGAIALYGSVADDAEAGAAAQREALYAAAMLSLAASGEARDVAAAGRYLDRLVAAAASEAERLEVAAARSLLGDLAALRAEADRLSGELAAATAPAAAGGEAELRRLRGDLAKSKAELAEAREEIGRKEEALRKIKETLVGRKDG